MAVEVLIPKLGLTMEYGLIEEWLVAPGTPVKPGDPLLRLATDKVDVEVEAEGSGLFHPAVESGAELPPGALIGWLLEAGEAPPGAPGEAAAGQAPPEAAPARPGRLFSSPNARRVARERGVDLTRLTGTGPGGRIITADILDATAAPQTPQAAQAAQTAQAARPRTVSPLVRRDATAAGVDLATVAGTGPGGKVLRSDIAAAVARPAPATQASTPVATQVIPLTGMRGVIATRMHASLQEMAQLTLGTEATMDAAVALRAQLKQQWQNVPTITDLVVRAAALSLRDHPRLNAEVRDNAIHLREEINVGLAVALQEGLMVPVLQRADQLPLSAMAAETRRLAQAARTGKLTLPELEGGTFTVSTLGSFGIDFFTPVITPGQVAILGVGRLRDGVRWDETTPVRTQVLTLSITFDHRAVDGAPAAEYLRSVASLLANPLTLLA
ncbi:MAG TPA: dihydrolipoamide acetyltransferase family protein [Streptosporangiaceae bacterium]|nr:dihydrolipoamide acetyltransferase family protein [Streptosporangiaceae bacterium]